MSPSARRRAWARPSRRLPLAAALTLLVPAWGMPSPAASLPAGVPPTGAVPAGVAPAGPDLARVTPSAGLRVLLDDVEPAVPVPDEPLRLTGRVLNAGGTPVRVSSVTASASPVPLASRTELSTWLDGEVDRDTSWVLGDDGVGPVVPAGGSVTFSVVVPRAVVAELPATASALALRLAVEGGEDQAVAELRTVLSSGGDGDGSTGPDGEPVMPLEVAWVVPLTLPPDPGLADPSPAAHSEAWMAAVGPGSEVDDLVGHLTLPEVTWVVDPALLVAGPPAPSVASAAQEAEETDPDLPAAAPPPDHPPEEGEPAEESAPAEEGGPGGESDPDGSSEDDAVPGTGPDPAPGTGDTPGGPATGAEASAATGTSPATEDQGGGPAGEPTRPAATPSDVAGALATLRADLARHPEGDLWWLPTDDPDLARLAQPDVPAGTAQELVRREPADVPAAVQRLLERGRAGLLWPALPAPTTDDLTRMAALWGEAPEATSGPGVIPTLALVPRESFTASSGAPPRRGAVPVKGTDLIALGSDSWTTALVAASGQDAEQHGTGAATQRVLAQTLTTWAESPSSPRELVITLPRGTDLAPEVLDEISAAWPDAGWIAPVSASELVGRVDGRDPVTLSGVPPEQTVLHDLVRPLLVTDSPLDASRARNLRQLSADLDGLAEVLQDTGSLRSWRPVLAGLWSTRWRQDPEAWPTTWRALRADLRSSRESLTVTPSSVNFLADQGTIHITVVNDLPVAVDDVRLRIEPDNARLRIVQQPDPVSIGPGSRASVPFVARAMTRGQVRLTATLTTPDGTALGSGAQLDVRVQPTGTWIYWVLGGLGGLVLVLGVGRVRSAPRVPRPPAGTGGTAYRGPAPAHPVEETPS